MHKNSITYHLFTSLFAVLLLIAPISQNWAYNRGLDQIKELKQAKQEDETSDEGSSDNTELISASTFQAVITTGIHLNFDVTYHFYHFPDPITPLKEIIQTPVLLTQPGYIQNICAYCIAPHAP